MSNPDSYYDPPEDDVEQEYCEYCNKPMEYHQDRLDKKTLDIWWKCTNEFCPEKWTSEIVHNMANHLAEVEQELADAKADVKFLRGRVNALESQLTPSQSDVVVRDTDYAIRRMDDTIEFLEISANPDFQILRKEWLEVKEILRQL